VLITGGGFDRRCHFWGKNIGLVWSSSGYDLTGCGILLHSHHWVISLMSCRCCSPVTPDVMH
jgi:hypothetical protein